MELSETDYHRIAQYVTSLTHLNGRMRPKYTRRSEIPTLSQQTPIQREAAAWLPKVFVELPRFEMPMNVHSFSQMTPVQYLTNYCTVHSRVKKLLYHRQYAKYRDQKVDGIDSLEKLKKALKDVCTFAIAAKSFSPSESSLNYYIHGILGFELEDNVKINFKMFMGISALAERIFNPNYMQSWWDSEKLLESDYQAYKKLREQEAQLRKRVDQREQEQAHQRSLQKEETEKRTLNAIRKLSARSEPRAQSTEIDERILQTERLVVLDVSASEQVLVDEVEEKRNRLEKKISVTKILEIESRPNKSPKELMEQIDFQGLKWKLRDVQMSRNMERLLKIVINL